MIDTRHILNCYESRDREGLERYLESLTMPIGVQDVIDAARYRRIRTEIVQDLKGCTAEQMDAKVDEDIRRHGS